MKHIGFFGLLTIVLVLLKATHYIDWSWWLVFLPVAIPYIFLALAFAVTLAFGVLGAILSMYNDRPRKY